MTAALGVALLVALIGLGVGIGGALWILQAEERETLRIVRQPPPEHEEVPSDPNDADKEWVTYNRAG